jgi:DNA-3-methyladenine glycosylase II
MRRIETDADIAAALDALAADPRLAACRAAVSGVPLRMIPAGLEGLLRIVSSQQLSTQSANAVWSRFTLAFEPLTAAAILAASDEELRAAGLSRQKAKTFRAVAAAVVEGLDLEALAEAEPDEARAALEAISGIGRWTADLYLMFAAGHPDIFPVGDLAVRKSAQRALSLAEEPKPEALAAIAEAWSPHRSTAARLLWAFYRVPPAGEATLVPESPNGATFVPV